MLPIDPFAYFIKDSYFELKPSYIFYSMFDIDIVLRASYGRTSFKGVLQKINTLTGSISSDKEKSDFNDNPDSSNDKDNLKAPKPGENPELEEETSSNETIVDSAREIKLNSLFCQSVYHQDKESHHMEIFTGNDIKLIDKLLPTFKTDTSPIVFEELTREQGKACIEILIARLLKTGDEDLLKKAEIFELNFSLKYFRFNIYRKRELESIAKRGAIIITEIELSNYINNQKLLR